MKKVIVELLIIACIFVTFWFALSKLDWMSIFRIEQISQRTEKKIGDLFVDIIKKSEIEITSSSVRYPIDSMLTRICVKNNIDKKQIKYHIIQKDEINAFALPNNHIVIYTGLIKACENESELCGVLCHEMAHLQKKHVMNKLIKDVGLSVLISMANGNGNGEMIKKTIQHLSSTAYDRNLESEADITAVDYLVKANIDPEPFANFLFRQADEEKIPSQLYWISTHPESKERSQKIIAHIKSKSIIKAPILEDSTWKLLKKKLQEE